MYTYAGVVITIYACVRAKEATTSVGSVTTSGANAADVNAYWGSYKKLCDTKCVETTVNFIVLLIFNYLIRILQNVYT